MWNHADGGNILKDFDTYDGAAGNGIYFYEGSNTAETFWGPRPNFNTTQVAEYIQDSIEMWIKEYHIAGFRWDSTICIRKPAESCWYGAASAVCLCNREGSDSPNVAVCARRTGPRAPTWTRGGL